MPKVIEVFIKEDKVKISTDGFVGSECKDAIAFLQKLGELESEEKKPEFYQQKVTQGNNVIKN